MTEQYFDMPFWHLGIQDPKIMNEKMPSNADFCIIGAGFTGLTVALLLLRAGKSVVIFDAMKLGHGASGKNGGMIGPSLHKLGLDGLSRKYGNEKALAILQEGMNAIDYFPKFIERENIDCDLKMTGRFRGITSKSDLDAVVKDCEKLMPLKGFQYEVVNEQDVQNEIGSTLYKGGIVYPRDGGLHPAKLQMGLVKKVIQLGGQIFEETCVGDIIKTPIGFQTTTDKGTMISDKVVVASNGYTKKYSGKSFSYYYKRLLPITSAMIATEELPLDVINRFFPKRRMHGGNHRLVQYYRASPDDKRVLFGARGTDQWDRPLQNGRELKSNLCKIFPEIENVKIEYSWSGKVAYTFDHTPHLGIKDGIYFAIGYCGSGVTRSIYLATKLARRILNQPDHQTAFDDLSFESKPLYNGNPWFIPIIMKWHNFLDNLEGK